MPDDWKCAHVIPLFKKGNRADPGNYRLVSLTSTSCNVLQHILFSHIMKHLDKYKILAEAQHDFRQKRSCEMQLIINMQGLSKALDNREQVDLVILDFTKAFDSVVHERLFQKLSVTV